MATGIARNSMIMGGRIIAIIPHGIEKSPTIGETVTTTISGAVGLGILPASVTAILIIIGGVVNGAQGVD